jgi:hypothetical protein
MILSRTNSNKQAAASQFTGVIEGWLLSRDFPDPDTTPAKAVVWWLRPERCDDCPGATFSALLHSPRWVED